MPRWVHGVCAAAVAVSVMAASSAEAARRPRTRTEGGPSTPEIRLVGGNTVPACVTPDRLMRFMGSVNDHLEPKFNAIAADYQRHGQTLGVRWDFAFYQMLLETNYLKFKKGDGKPGDVRSKQNNFAGLGATGGGVPGESFPDVSTGVLAQMQHLVAYSGEMVGNPVAQRTRDNQDGIVAQSKRLGRAVRFGDLTNRWAADSNYARSITSVSDRFRDGYCKDAADQPQANVQPLAAPEKPAGAALAKKAVIEQQDIPRAALGATAAAAAAAKPAVTTTGRDCQVMSASFGGAVTLLIRSETPKAVTLTALDVSGGNEDAQANAYIASHAQGGKITGRFKTRTEAVDHAYGLCDSGRP